MTATTPTAGAETLELMAGELPVTALAWGPADGPLALCLHGYPDTARTWRHLGPHLAEAGWRVVAPYMRGYAPTGLAPDGTYQLGAMAHDVEALHAALGGDERAVLIGHDWGAAIAYIVGGHRPEMFRRIVTMAVPPQPILYSSLSSPGQALRDIGLIARQLRASWYIFFNQLPGIPERVLGRLIPWLWKDWSPGYDGREDVAHVLEGMRDPARRSAALGYYRCLVQRWRHIDRYADEQRHEMDVPPGPLLYLHGAQDGCMMPELVSRAADILPEGSRFELVPGVGHFLQLESPEEVNARIAAFIGPA